MKGLIILGNHFEDVEALATIDVLKRSGLVIISCGIDCKSVVSQSQIMMTTDIILQDVKVRDYDFLVIPGGRAVYEILNKDSRIDSLIDEFISQNKLIATICAAPILLGKRGYFKDKKYTCFKGCEEDIIAGEKVSQNVVNDYFITAKSMYYSIDFALEIIEKLQGTNQKNKILKQIKSL